jgi:type I restriction enzyme R subunit
VVIDEAHSSQGGKTAGAMSAVLADPEDVVNDALQKRMDERKLATNASYFAFTATPKNKTLELFGDALPADAEGKVRHRPFHPYTMKQAIDEGFILDVLKSYTTIHCYYRLIKTAENDPVFEVRRARKKLRQRVEGDDHAIERKAEIMVEHFLDQVAAPRKVEGLARAMVVTGGVERAIQYFHAIQAQLVARQSPYRAIVAFAGEFEYQGLKVSEAMLNGFPGNDIAERIAQDPYRFLVCADKFQTGYDEPLMHTMYVDKALAGIKAVQTLSRLNRARRGKLDTFVLDFYNEAAVIQEAFAAYYRTTILSEETDANKLHDLKADLDGLGVYSQGEVEAFVTLFLNGAARDQLDPILDGCAAVYDQLDEDGQVKFKGSAKAFVRTYDFLGAILRYGRPEWEKLSILLSLLVLKLKSPKEEDLAPGILEAVDMDSYRAEKQVAVRLQLPDEDALIGPCRWRVEVTSPIRSTTSSPTSSRPSTSSSAPTSTTPTASCDASGTTSPPRWPPIRPIKTR